MYLNLTVPMPSENGKLTIKTIKGTPYVYYETGRTYDATKKYNSPKRVCIGKQCKDHPGMISPNTSFLRFFPEAALPEETEDPERSSCLHVGAYLVIRKVINDYFLDRMIAKISDFLGWEMDNQRTTFLNEWNKKRDHREKIYISYDSTNKICILLNR